MSIDISYEMVCGMENVILGVVRKAVEHCGLVHGFDAELMLRNMNVNMVSCSSASVSVSSSSRSSIGPSGKKEKVVKEKVVKEKVVEKSKLPMPFSGKKINECCEALRQNHGLYTQCETIVKGDEKFCKKCVNGDKFGTINQRIEAGLMEFRDPKGKAPTAFVKVMNKLKISREEVEEAAGKLNIIIDDIHFQEEKTEKKEKGRPKKAKKVVVLDEDSSDLFAELVAKANEDSDSEDDNSIADTVSLAESIVDSVLDNVNETVENNEKEAVKLAEKQKKLAEKQKKETEKAEKEAAKLAEKEAEKQKKEAEKAEKAEKEAAKLAEKEAEKQKKEAEKQKKEAEKAEKEAAKLAEKETEKKKKEAEKAEKEAAKLAEKEAEKKKKEAEKKGKKESSSDSETDKKNVKAKKGEDEEEDVVKRFEFEGVKYLRSKKTGVIYNMDQDVIGKWNEKTSKIDFIEANSDEEEEDEYDM